MQKIQTELAGKIKLENSFDPANLSIVAGVDIAYKKNSNKCVCCIVAIDYKTKQIKEKISLEDTAEIPYIPGFLAFRELPSVLKAVKKLTVAPDLFMFDGNGYLHPRHMGLATHASFYLNKPTIGVAKTYFKIGDTDFIMPENISGSYTDITINNKIYGRVLRTRKDVKPVFISCGNYIDIDTAVSLTMHFVEQKEGRLPAPVRHADIYTYEMLKKLEL